MGSNEAEALTSVETMLSLSTKLEYASYASEIELEMSAKQLHPVEFEMTLALMFSLGCWRIGEISLSIAEKQYPDMVHAQSDCFLRFASQRGHTQAVRVLLRRGANVHATSTCPHYGTKSAVYEASVKGYTDTVLVLLEAGAKVDEIAPDYIETHLNSCDANTESLSAALAFARKSIFIFDADKFRNGKARVSDAISHSAKEFLCRDLILFIFDYL